MNPQDPNSWPGLNPFESMKKMQDAWMSKFSEVMGDFVASEKFSKSLGQSISRYMETAAPFQKQFESFMEKNLQRVSMPTRNDVIQLSERLNSIEMRLDDLEAKGDEILDLLQALHEQKKDGENG